MSFLKLLTLQAHLFLQVGGNAEQGSGALDSPTASTAEKQPEEAITSSLQDEVHMDPVDGIDKRCTQQLDKDMSGIDVGKGGQETEDAVEKDTADGEESQCPDSEQQAVESNVDSMPPEEERVVLHAC